MQLEIDYKPYGEALFLIKEQYPECESLSQVVEQLIREHVMRKNCMKLVGEEDIIDGDE